MRLLLLVAVVLAFSLLLSLNVGATRIVVNGKVSPEVVNFAMKYNSTPGLAVLKLINRSASYAGRFIPAERHKNVIELNVFFGVGEETMRHEMNHLYCWETERYIGHQGCFRSLLLQSSENFLYSAFAPSKRLSGVVMA